MGNCLGGFGEGTPAATAGSGTSFPHGDFTAISFIGLKDQGKRSLVKAIAAAYDVELCGGIEEKNRVVCKFVTEIDGKMESVQIYISHLEDIETNPEKPVDHPELAVVDVFAFIWSVANEKKIVEENFGKYYMYLSQLCKNRGDNGIFVFGSQTDKTALISKDDFNKIYSAMEKRDIDFHYTDASIEKKESIKPAIEQMIRQRRLKKWSDNL